MDHCTKLSFEGELMEAALSLFSLEWEDSNAVYEVFSQVNQVIEFYSELFLNKTSAVVFSKKLVSYVCAGVFEHFAWTVKNCFHKRNVFKKFEPRVMRYPEDKMKRRADTKALLTSKETFARLVQRDAACFQEFLQNASFYIPKSNQVCSLRV